MREFEDEEPTEPAPSETMAELIETARRRRTVDDEVTQVVPVETIAHLRALSREPEPQ